MKKSNPSEKRLDSSDEETEKETKKELLTKSLDLHKKLKKDMTPEEESDLVKEIKADLEKDHGTELVERDIKSMTKALDQVPAHDPPHLNDEIKKQQADEKADLLKNLDKRGKT